MRLSRVEINDYRSVFVDERSGPLALDLAEGMNTLVGANNCGKSNVLRAVALALDPNARYDPSIDNPGPRPFAHPMITLHFEAAADNEDDAELLKICELYEASISSGVTNASGGLAVLRVSFEPTSEGTTRREVLINPSHAVPTQPEQQLNLDRALSELRERIRFVLISSGESIRSVLDGNFREILHSVVKDRLAEAFARAEASRGEYVSGLTESLLGPLRERLVQDVGQLFPEIDNATLTPEVPTIDRTLSNVSVSLEDLVVTPLSEKGTGTRGGVLIAMLSYLAVNATRGMIFALEEPEAFLHPASQEDLRDKLDEIASLPGITLLVTTHSPFVATRSPEGKVFGLAKDNAGRTRVSDAISGNEDHAPLVGALFRESTFEDLLKSASALPSEAKALLLVEGDGDKKALELVSRVVGRSDLLDGFHIVPTGGAIKLIATAIIARASTDKPVLVLVDHDESGLHARDTLCGRTFEFKKGKDVITYASVFPEPFQNFPVEAEDLFDADLIDSFVEAHGVNVVDGTKRRPDGAFHYDFGIAAKVLLDEFLERETEPKHVTLWLELILKMRDLVALGDLDVSVDTLIEQAPELAPFQPKLGRAMIVTGNLDYPRYQQRGVLVLDTAAELPPDVTHVGFYSGGEIKPELARVLQHYPGIHFSDEVVDQLKGTGAPQDAVVAALVYESLRVEDQLSGSTHQLILLSPVGDPETVTLGASVVNTKERAGKKMAWTIGPKLVSMSSLLQEPKTTSELDELDGGIE